MALLAPVVFNRPIKAIHLGLRLIILSAVLVFLINLRTTAIAVVPSVVVVLLLYQKRGFLWRFAQTACFLVSFVALSWSLDVWWEHKYEEAAQVVESLGGQPFRARIYAHHDIMHVIWMGLDDFDEKYEFRWRDYHPHQYAIPLLKKAGFEPHEDELRYGILWQKVPGYSEIIRAKLIETVRNDPGWYLNILGQRIERILFENEAPKLNLVFGTVVLPSIPWILLLFAFALVLFCAMPFIKLLILAAPTASVAVLATTYGGQQFLSITHLVLSALLLTACCRLAAFVIGRLVGRVGAGKQ